MISRIREHLSRSLRMQCRSFHKERYHPFAPHALSGGSGPQKAIEGYDEIVVTNPANGETLSTILSASPGDIATVIDRAQDIFQSGIWSRSSVFHRSDVLSRLARALEKRVPEFAKLETLQTGRAIREMSVQLSRVPEWLDYYAALLRTYQGYLAPTKGKLLNYVHRIPLGLVAQITPFNHPLLIAVKKLAPALAAGNSVIIKPSELAPIAVLEFAEMAIEVGVPPGVISVLPGFGASTGTEVVRNPLIRKVDITAGTQTGRALGGIVGSNLAAFTAELGGKAPIVVFDDADLACAVNGTAFASFVASGQTCVSGTRLIVQNGIYDKFMTRFLEKAKSIQKRMGNPLNPRSTMGTIISPRHLERIEEKIMRRKHGTILTGGERMHGVSALDGYNFSRGCFFPPTVIADVTTKDELWQDEIFGPVVVVMRFKDESESIELANACKYGLGSSIWTSNLSRAHRIASEIDAGLVWVNTHHRNDPSSPWGGMKESGIGRENGIEALESYSQSKSTIINIASEDESRIADDWFADDETEKRYG